MAKEKLLSPLGNWPQLQTWNNQVWLLTVQIEHCASQPRPKGPVMRDLGSQICLTELSTGQHGCCGCPSGWENGHRSSLQVSSQSQKKPVACKIISHQSRNAIFRFCFLQLSAAEEATVSGGGPGATEGAWLTLAGTLDGVPRDTGLPGESPRPPPPSRSLCTAGASHREHPNSPNYSSSKAWLSGQFTVAKFSVFLIKSFKKLGLSGQRNSLLLWPIVCLEIVCLGILFPLLIKVEFKKSLFQSGDNGYKRPFAFSLRCS